MLALLADSIIKTYRGNWLYIQECVNIVFSPLGDLYNTSNSEKSFLYLKSKELKMMFIFHKF